MENSSKIQLSWRGFVLIAVLASFPWGAADGKDLVIRRGQPLRIATMDIPAFGLSTRNAVDLAIEQTGGAFQGHAIQTKHFGRGCDQRVEMDAFIQGLIREPKTVGLVGPICSGRTRRIVQTLSDAQILTISPANTFSGFSDPAFHATIPYYFRTSPNDRYQGPVAAAFAASPPAQNGLGLTQAAILYYGPGDDYTDFIVEGFREAFLQAGGTIVAEIPIMFDQTDFTDALAQLGSAEFVYAPIFELELLPFYTQLRESRGDLPLITSDSAAGDFFLELIGSDPVNLYASNTIENGPQYSTFVADYLARFGHEPGPFEALAYDATRLLLGAVAAASITDSQGNLTIPPEAMLAAMNDANNYPYEGAGGSYQTPVNGDLNPAGWAVFQGTVDGFLPVYP